MVTAFWGTGGTAKLNAFWLKLPAWLTAVVIAVLNVWLLALGFRA